MSATATHVPILERLAYSEKAESRYPCRSASNVRAACPFSSPRESYTSELGVVYPPKVQKKYRSGLALQVSAIQTKSFVTCLTTLPSVDFPIPRGNDAITILFCVSCMRLAGGLHTRLRKCFANLRHYFSLKIRNCPRSILIR